MKRIAAVCMALTSSGLVLGGCRERAQESSNGAEIPADILTISQGEKVNLADHLFAGQTTIVEFFSEHSPGCAMLGPELRKLAAKRDDIGLLRVDINWPEVTDRVDFGSPVARQFELGALPHVVVFHRDGHKRAEGDEAMELVVGWLGS